MLYRECIFTNSAGVLLRRTGMYKAVPSERAERSDIRSGGTAVYSREVKNLIARSIESLELPQSASGPELR